MSSCPYCNGTLIKYGFLKKEKTQRYRCKACRRMSSDAQNRTFGVLRTNPDKIVLVIRLLTEGMGVRAAGRLAGVHRDTVLRILKHAGQRSYSLLRKKLVNVPVTHVEADEIWTYVLKRAPDLNPEMDFNPWGEYYVYLGLDQKSKFLLMPTIGKRSDASTEWFAKDLRRSISNRFQLSTDGFRPYKVYMKKHLGDRADFAQYFKEFNMLKATQLKKSPNPLLKDSANLYAVRCGNPDAKLITTAHVERANLTLRTFNRRFNRRSICFSKAEEYLTYSVYLFVAYNNFCWEHSALGRKKTPAMALGMAQKPWTVTELMTNTL